MTEEKLYEMLKERNSAAIIGHLGGEPTLIDFRNSKGVSLLQLASYFGLIDLRDYILQHRSPSDIFEASSAGIETSVHAFLLSDPKLINTYSADGFTPLGFAAYFRHATVVKLLLRRGADPNLSSNNAFRVAPLHSAVASNSLDICRMLLESGANSNALQQKNITPLHSSAHNGNVAITRLLLEFGANPTLQCEEGKLPIDYAREAGAAEVEAILTAIK